MRLADKIATMARRGTPLPYDAEVEWIEFTGSQRIFLEGLTPNIYTKGRWKFDIELTRTTGSQQSGSNLSYIRFCDNGKFWESILEIENDLNRHLIEFGRGEDGKGFELYLDNTFVTGLTGAFFNSSNTEIAKSFCLGGLLLSDTVFINGMFARLYGVSFERSDYSLNLIPVRVGSEGAMYDLISGQLFRNQGTDAFIVGPDK